MFTIIDTVASSGENRKGGDISREGVQRDFLSLIKGLTFIPIAFVIGNIALLSRAICFLTLCCGISIFYSVLLRPITYLTRISLPWPIFDMLLLLNFKAINNISKQIELLVERLFLINDDAPDIFDAILIPLHYFVPYFQNSNTLAHTDKLIMLPMPITYQKLVCAISNITYNTVYYSMYGGPPIVTGWSIFAIRQVFAGKFLGANILDSVENEVVNGNHPDRFQIAWFSNSMRPYTETGPFEIFRKDSHAFSIFAAVNIYYETIAFQNYDLILTIADDSQQLLLGLMFVTPDTCNNINNDLV